MGKQLRLWPDDQDHIEVQCEHCGWRFNARPQLEQRQANMESRVLTHPRVLALPARTRDFLTATLPVFSVVRVIGVYQLAETAGYSPSGAHGQIKKLVRNHVFKRVPKGEKYCQYQLAI